jgi:hypothetical protein
VGESRKPNPRNALIHRVPVDGFTIQINRCWGLRCNQLLGGDMNSEARIAELEEQLRLVQKNQLEKVQLEKSRLGNVYWDYDSDKEARTRPYEGNDRDFVSVFANEQYAKFIQEHKELQEYWRSPMYCIKRQPDGYKQVCSNIHRGDFFGCGKTSQVGHVYNKITHIQCGLKKEYQKPSPAGQGGNYITYNLGGDIGGHWYNPTHDDFTATGHFLWLPTIERLMFAGFPRQAGELRGIMNDIISST